jgi:hypothetical protein
VSGLIERRVLEVNPGSSRQGCRLYDGNLMFQPKDEIGKNAAMT